MGAQGVVPAGCLIFRGEVAEGSRGEAQRRLLSQAEDQHDRELGLLLLELGLVCDCDIPLVFFLVVFCSSTVHTDGSWRGELTLLATTEEAQSSCTLSLD